jgi:hypothetical protein
MVPCSPGICHFKILNPRSKVNTITDLIVVDVAATFVETSPKVVLWNEAFEFKEAFEEIRTVDVNAEEFIPGPAVALARVEALESFKTVDDPLVFVLVLPDSWILDNISDWKDVRKSSALDPSEISFGGGPSLLAAFSKDFVKAETALFCGVETFSSSVFPSFGCEGLSSSDFGELTSFEFERLPSGGLDDLLSAEFGEPASSFEAEGWSSFAPVSSFV